MHNLPLWLAHPNLDTYLRVCHPICPCADARLPCKAGAYACKRHLAHAQPNLPTDAGDDPPEVQPAVMVETPNYDNAENADEERRALLGALVAGLRDDRGRPPPGQLFSYLSGN